VTGFPLRCFAPRKSAFTCRGVDLIPDRFVHIVDDDQDVRNATRFLLRTHNIDSQAYQSGADFLGQGKLDRGVVLLDLRMDNLDGLQVLEELRQRGCVLPVLLVSGHGNIALAVGAMKLGALDFIEKPYESSELISSLDRAFAMIPANNELHLARTAATRVVKALTPRQRQILQGMVAGQSNKVMARLFGISPRTIETHRAHMLDRLGVSNISDAIRIANAAGLPEIDRETKADPSLADRKERGSVPQQGQLALS
jgi:two-component system, LuxR family, response regulator FixJ